MANWPEIVGEHGSVVWRTAMRLLSNEADASDCFQRTFVSAWELDRKQPIRHWPALLRRLATARALEKLRTRYRHLERYENLPTSLVADDAPRDVTAALEATELAEQLRWALARIDGRQAEVFCLACLEDCSYRHIAQQIGISVNHVGVLLNRAKASLRVYLREHAPIED